MQSRTPALNKQNRWSRKAVEHPPEFYLYVRIKSSNIWFDTEAPSPPFYIALLTEKVAFLYTFYGAPFTYLAEKYISLLTAVNVLYIWTNRKTRTAFSRPFHNHKMRQLALLGLSLQTEMTNFATLSYISAIEFPTLFIYPEIENAAFPRTGNYTPPPPTGFYPGNILVFHF